MSKRGRTSPFGNTVREARKAKGMLLEELAASVGLSQSYLSRIENGVLVPLDDNVERLARALGHATDEWLSLAKWARVNRTAEHEQMSQAFFAGDWMSTGKHLHAPTQFEPTTIKHLLTVLRSELEQGLAHGSFDFRITCQKASDGARHVVVNTGRIFQFEIPASEDAGGQKPGKSSKRRGERG